MRERATDEEEKDRGLSVNCVGFASRLVGEGLDAREQEEGFGKLWPPAPQEWPDPKDWSLQETDAFVLVYDICSPDSFDYVKALRQRIAETR